MNRFVALTLVGLLAMCSFALASPDSGFQVADCSGTACYGVVDCSAPAVASCSGTVSVSNVCPQCGRVRHAAPVVTTRAYRIEHGGWYLGKAAGAVVKAKPIRRAAVGTLRLGKGIVTAPVKAVRAASCANGQCNRQ